MPNTEKCNELIHKVAEKNQHKRSGKNKKTDPEKVMTDRQVAVAELIEKSQMSLSQIARATNYSPSAVTLLKQRLNSHSIITPKLLRLAKRRLTDILELKPFPAQRVDRGGAVISYQNYPDHAAVNAAIDKIIDRSEPAVHKVESRSMAMQFISPIDLSTFRLRGGEVSNVPANSANDVLSTA